MLVWCAAQGTVIFSLEWSVMLAGRTSSCSSTACCLGLLGDCWKVHWPPEMLDCHWVTPHSSLCVAGQIFSRCWCCLPSKVDGSWQWYLQVVSLGNALRGTSEIFWLQFLMIWYFLNVSRPNGHKLLLSCSNTYKPCAAVIMITLSCIL